MRRGGAPIAAAAIVACAVLGITAEPAHADTRTVAVALPGGPQVTLELGTVQDPASGQPRLVANLSIGWQPKT